jgi:hypothetical protein
LYSGDIQNEEEEKINTSRKEIKKQRKKQREK